MTGSPKNHFPEHNKIIYQSLTQKEWDIMRKTLLPSRFTALDRATGMHKASKTDITE